MNICIDTRMYLYMYRHTYVFVTTTGATTRGAGCLSPMGRPAVGWCSVRLIQCIYTRISLW